MTLVLVPIGPGNWREARMSYTGPQSAPFLARVGERFTVAGVTWRVRRVEP
jgi:hypothetical protein